MQRSQMELPLAPGSHRAMYRTRRQTRAQWWFARMRQVVDSIPDWRPGPAGRPEQMWLTS